MRVWMLVSKDKFELPLAVADSAKELARITGKRKNTIRSSVSRETRGKTARSIYVAVEIDEDEKENDHAKQY